MKSLLIQGGHIIDPAQGINGTGSLLITGSKISWLGRGETTPPQTNYDILHARGLIVCSGFIDLHCHLRQPGFEEKESIATGTRAAARGGFTTVCCMPNTSPPLDNQAVIDYVKSTAERKGIIRVIPIGCITRERKGEELTPLDELASAGVVGFSDDGDSVSDITLMHQALEWSHRANLPIIEHCEDKAFSGDGQMNTGVIAERLGLPGIPAAAEENIVARDIALAEETGGWLHIAHVSTEGSVELIRRAKDKGIRVTAEVTPHHLTLTEDMVVSHGTRAKVNPPLRTERDISILIQGLKDNTIDIIATDHAPHTKADKDCDFTQAASGISGFETALGSLLGLIHDGRLTLPVLIARISNEPAKILGNRWGELGTLVVDTPADITIFDPEMEWVVDTSKFVSKGKNTPLEGTTLKGKVVATISRGKLVYQNDSVKIERRIRDKVNYG